ncbi:hypothetical protein PNOK_0841800 [Pyrrhoderma noxium]|uniref:Uncharacterized protein n=1 Tax=Pyrrhoderma noxium TaxID=2282107 RepID=A0A286U7L5_9AGAM|nr:hypothetical protein PNOK_0841800 [Pyrrhoderma noxium]
MGPPSRYTLLAQAERRALEAQAKIAEEDGNLNTSDLSNSDWVKYHLRRLAAASSEDEFLARAKQCFTRRTNVTLNGIHVSRELYAQQWGAHLKPNGCGSILFQGEMETPDIKVPMMHNAALVGIFYSAKFYSNGSGMDSPLEVSSTVNIIVAEDKSVLPSSTDRRRMFTINQVLVDRAGNLTFPLRNEL